MRHTYAEWIFTAYLKLKSRWTSFSSSSNPGVPKGDRSLSLSRTMAQAQGKPFHL